MNSANEIPVVEPPPIPSRPGIKSPPLGDLPADCAPITSPTSAIEAVLREPRRLLFHLRQPKRGPLIAGLLTISVVCSAIYGFVIGTFSGGEQLWAAPVKVVCGLLFAALICLPSLYILACLGGSRARLGEVLGLMSGLVTLTTVLLIGFAPVAWVFSQSTESLIAMGSLHLVFWLVATWFGLRFLHSGFAQLGVTVGGGIKLWMIIFIIVVLQMTTALRPIVGKANTFLPTQKKFFVTHWLDNLKGAASNEMSIQQH